MGRLTVDLGAVRHNFKLIQDKVGANCAVAPAIKANAYGCGIAALAPVLKDAGAKAFFVATMPEALELRTIIGDAPEIYMLGGFETQSAGLYTEENITPVLNSMLEIERYGGLASQENRALPAILHIDTGMNRLGLEKQDLVEAPKKLDGIDVHYVMSHFACSDEKDSPVNAAQYEAFKSAAETFPSVQKSLANSSGIFRSADYHLDMVRPGMALYGLNPTPETDNPMRPVVTLDISVLQIKEAKAGETCGYNATYRFEKNTKLAIVAMGYADGFFRALSNKGSLYWKGYKCPVRGNVSMDLTIVDLGEVPESDLPVPGDHMEIIGPNQSADDLARACGTIGYEVLTSLSRRYHRIYKD